MANCRVPNVLGWDIFQKGYYFQAPIQYFTDEFTPLVCKTANGPVGLVSPTVTAVTPITDAVRMLAATAYGEGSTKDVFEEMAAIANVLVRQQIARGYKTIVGFISSDKTYAFAAHDGNSRYKRLMAAKEASILADKGMLAAIQAAQNALAVSPVDYSNGAYFWDGADIKSNYDKHPKVRAGIRFSDPVHNIYAIQEKDVKGEEWWRNTKGENTKLRGTWTHKYVSTAAFGGTIFWKYEKDFVKATGNKEHD
jgi:hypothetical protein